MTKLQKDSSALSEQTAGLVSAKHHARRPEGFTIARIARKMHAVVGLILGAYFLLMSITGVVLVFADEIEDALIKVPAVQSNSPHLDLEGIVDKFTAQISGGKITFISVRNPNAYKIYFSKEGENASAYVNPADGIIYSDLSPPPVLEFVKDLHHNLLLGKPGRKANGACAIFLLLLAVSGSYLFVRSGLNKKNFSIRNAATKGISMFKSHRSLGMLSAPFLLIWAVSAINFAFPSEFKLMLTPFYSKTGDGANQPGHKRNLNELLHKAQIVAPNEKLEELSFPKSTNPAYRFWFTNKCGLLTEVWTSQDGTVLATTPPDSCPAAQSITPWLTRLHFGRAAGKPGKLLWALVGLSPALLFVTAAAARNGRVRRRRQNEE